MKLFDKLKNILFEEEEVEVPIIKNEVEHEKVEEVKQPEEQFQEVSRFRSKSFENLPIEKVEEVQAPKEEKSPFQQFDEEEFERIAAINKNKLLERDRRAREEKNRLESVSFDKVTDYERPKYHEEKIVKEEPKHFVLSPVISPVYGILDKNYSKEDLLPKASSDGTLPKIMDVDSVRKKAFGALEVDIEDVINSKEEKNIDDEIICNDSDDLINTNEIKITSFDEEPIKEPIIEEELTKDIADEEFPEDNNIIEELDEMAQIEKDEKPEKKEKNDDALESDLFNLIDSMYQEKGENK